MKKKKLLIAITLTFCIGCFSLGKLLSSKNIVKENNTLKNLSSLNTISMMLETDAGSGEYTMETRSSWPSEGYVFNGELSKCENGSTLSWDEDNNVVVMSGNITDKCYAYFDVYNEPETLAEYVYTQYNGVQGNNNIYYHNSSLTNGAGDNSYRYSGANPNNYVCFGSDASTCPSDNLYRIIGVFGDRVRLIKADYATSEMLGTNTNDYKGTYSENISSYQGESLNLTNIVGYYWNKVNYDASYSATGYYNDWNYSELNITHLNKNYISYLDNINAKWANMIDTTEWKVGGNTYANMYQSNAKTAYTNEITSPSNQVTSTYESKIGLMYVSDYGYAASQEAWTTSLNNYNSFVNDNWMYMGLIEWSMTRSVSFSGFAYGINETGNVYHYTIHGNSLAVRPVFHLLPSVEYVSGDGSKNSPIKIS